MVYVIIICIVAVVAAGVFFKAKLKTPETQNPSISLQTKEDPSLTTPQNETGHDLVIQVETLPAEAISCESNLVEITDSKILARINDLIPNLAQAGNAANNAVQAVETQGEVLYRAILPAGAKLTNSREMEGAVRGFYHGADGIQGHANLVAVEGQKGAAIISNTAVAAMGIASIVVGQYYMTQINTELQQISDGISKISNFQDNEYRSRVFSLVNHVKTIAEFQVEILENDELRLSKIAQLDSLEEECTKLLGQANLTLAGFTKGTGLDFETYETKLQEAQNWFIYQNTLLEMLYKIADLKFTLHLGAVSRAQCTALLLVYTQQVEKTQSCLIQWHQDSTNRLNIDTAEIRRKREGWDKAIHFFPGLINNNWNFRAISKKTANMIDSQTSGHRSQDHDDSDFYLEDVELISKDGKVYYLPPHKD